MQVGCWLLVVGCWLCVQVVFAFFFLVICARPTCVAQGDFLQPRMFSGASFIYSSVGWSLSSSSDMLLSAKAAASPGALCLPNVA